jgi:hypothetical protein
MNYFEFVINPDSFTGIRLIVLPALCMLTPNLMTETVENIFDLSFLIKQGVAQVKVQDNTPYVCMSFPPLAVFD